VKDHVEQIKTNYPGVEVEVRRDRDGYSIIKTKFKPKYKYNLEDVLAYDPKGENEKIKESLEDILKTMMGGTQGTNALLSLDKL
jgi:hypothetical protein